MTILITQLQTGFNKTQLAVSRTHGHGRVSGSDTEVLAARDAGLWFARDEAGPKRSAVRHAKIHYYAKGALTGLPYAGSETTLRYPAAKNVDFIVLESEDAPTLPTIEEWFAHGIPNDRARLIYDRTNSEGDRVAIYRLQTDSPQ